MPEWTVHIDSKQGLGDEEILLRFHDALTAAPDAHGAATGMAEPGVLTSTFQVDAASAAAAAERAHGIIVPALALAGVVSSNWDDVIAHLEVERDCVHAAA